jgi:hypothetical protein
VGTTVAVGTDEGVVKLPDPEKVLGIIFTAFVPSAKRVMVPLPALDVARSCVGVSRHPENKIVDKNRKSFTLINFLSTIFLKN